MRGQPTRKLSQTCIKCQNKGKPGCYRHATGSFYRIPILLQEGCLEGLKGKNDEIKGWQGGWMKGGQHH